MNLPDSFTSYTRRLMGDELYNRFAAALDAEPPVSIRINPLKTGPRGGAAGESYGGALPVADGGAVAVPWCDGAYYLSERPNFTFDPLLHAGHYYVQEASSMFVHHVLRSLVSRPVRMLDLCAAPGGKSTAAIAALPAGSMLMSNEPVRARANVLAENIQKWGSPSVIVTNSYPRDYARSGLTFDVILCDVPCSGEGMFRKDEGAVGEWSPQNVERCRDLQREIVGEAWKCLRPGGLLIYSTCTFNAMENEENVAWIMSELGGTPLAVPVDEDWGIHGSLLDGFTAPVYRFIPGCTRGEGLFMAVLRKGAAAADASGDAAAAEPAATAAEGRDRRVAKKCGREKEARGRHGKTGARADGRQQQACAPLSRKEVERMVAEWTVAGAMPVSDGLAVTAASLDALTTIYAGPSALRADSSPAALALLSQAVVSGNAASQRPAHALALSAIADRSAFPVVDLPYAQAVAYLRHDAIVLPSDTPRGFVLVTYRGAALGFVKNVGNRANNLYPQEWKIKSTHVPDEPRVVGL